MEFDEDKMEDDPEKSFMLNKPSSKQRLDKTGDAIKKQNNMIQEALKTGMKT
jgi:hypothetical protein